MRAGSRMRVLFRACLLFWCSYRPPLNVAQRRPHQPATMPPKLNPSQIVDVFVRVASPEKSVQVLQDLDPMPMLPEDFLESLINLMHSHVSPAERNMSGPH